jgi:glutamate-1-semialdehyde aminotransferase
MSVLLDLDKPKWRASSKIYGVDPDMAIFGKALGNGYAITAVIGKKEVMDSCTKHFYVAPLFGLKELDLQPH